MNCFYFINELSVSDVKVATKFFASLLNVTFCPTSIETESEALIGNTVLRVSKYFRRDDWDNYPCNNKRELIRNEQSLVLIVPDIQVAYEAAVFAGAEIVGDSPETAIRTNLGGRSDFYAYAPIEPPPRIKLCFYDTVLSSFETKRKEVRVDTLPM